MAWSGKFELNGNALSTGGQLLACSAARAVQAVEPSTQFSAKRFRLRRQPARSSLNRAGSVLVGEGLRVEAPAGSASPSARLRSTCLQISIKVSAAGNDAVASAQPRRNHGATTAQPRRNHGAAQCFARGRHARLPDDPFSCCARHCRVRSAAPARVKRTLQTRAPPQAGRARVCPDPMFRNVSSNVNNAPPRSIHSRDASSPDLQRVGSTSLSGRSN